MRSPWIKVGREEELCRGQKVKKGDQEGEASEIRRKSREYVREARRESVLKREYSSTG